VPALASAEDTTIPPPEPIVTHIGKTPLVELSDGGGGLPYLGSSTSYNAGDWENTLRAFHDTGVYDTELAQIDMSNYSAINADNFTFGPSSQAEATNEIGVAIKPTLDHFNLAKSKGVAVFFITGRREATRQVTTENLTREGYSGWAELVLKPAASTQTTVAYKSGARGHRAAGLPHLHVGRRPVLRPRRRARGHRVQAPQPVLLPAVDSPRGR
jgi:hypothetical protein